MYAKVHSQIFESSIMEADLETRYVWFCLLAMADKEGFIDATIAAIARKINIKKDIVEKAIAQFMEPDESSRTPDFDGRRLVKIRESFGWKIVNYEKYRDIRTAEERRDYMREYMKEYRAKKSKSPKKNKKKTSKQDVNTCKQPLTMLANTDTEAYAYTIPPISPFENFWKVYPKKKSKGNAEKAWAKLKPSPDMVEKIIRAVETAKKTKDWKKDNGQYIPYPASWLNAKGWEDEVSVQSQKSENPLVYWEKIVSLAARGQNKTPESWPANIRNSIRKVGGIYQIGMADQFRLNQLKREFFENLAG